MKEVSMYHLQAAFGDFPQQASSTASFVKCCGSGISWGAVDPSWSGAVFVRHEPADRYCSQQQGDQGRCVLQDCVSVGYLDQPPSGMQEKTSPECVEVRM